MFHSLAVAFLWFEFIHRSTHYRELCILVWSPWWGTMILCQSSGPCSSLQGKLHVTALDQIQAGTCSIESGSDLGDTTMKGRDRVGTGCVSCTGQQHVCSDNYLRASHSMRPSLKCCTVEMMPLKSFTWSARAFKCLRKSNIHSEKHLTWNKHAYKIVSSA